MANILVVYYSHSNTTKNLAEDIAIMTDGEIRELLPEEPYSFAYHGATKKARSEIERGSCPKLLSGHEPVNDNERAYQPELLRVDRRVSFLWKLPSGDPKSLGERWQN